MENRHQQIATVRARQQPSTSVAFKRGEREEVGKYFLMEHKVNHELRTTADGGMNKRCRERETEMLTERQIDFNINL